MTICEYYKIKYVLTIRKRHDHAQTGHGLRRFR